MNIARILYPVTVLGPGKRIGIWVAGCSRRCPGCSNPELWEKKPKYEIPVDEVFKLVNAIATEHQIDGFTITGGEPFDQAAELVELIEELWPFSSDLLLYTGYSIGKLKSQPTDNMNKLLGYAAVIIDGPYIEELNNNLAIQGSSNQRIHILNPDYETRYAEYLKTATNAIQNFTATDGVVSVGIHRRGFTAKTMVVGAPK